MTVRQNTPGELPPHRPLGLAGRGLVLIEVISTCFRVRRWSQQRPMPEVLKRVRALPVKRPARYDTDNPWTLASITVRVLTLLPGDTRCLMRSLTLVALLSRRGIESTLVIGAEEGGDAFEGHAWVEYQGIPLLRPLSQERRLVEL